MATVAAIASALVAVPSGVLAAPPKDAAPPDFQAPWACGETWYGATYPDHGTHDLALDFNEADDAEAGQAVLAAAPGVVHAADRERFDASDERVHDGKLRMADETELEVGKRGAEVSLWRFNGQVYIDHGNGWYSFYAHLDPALPRVADGTEVKTGDLLGYVDRTPNPLMASGAHLHYEQKHDPKQPYSVYEAKTERMQFRSVNVAALGERESVQVLSMNCDRDGIAADLARQATGFTDDLVAVRRAGNGSLGIRRYLIDDASQVMTSHERVSVRPQRVADRVLTGDFTNDGVDDVAMVVQQRDGSFQVKVWSEGRYRVGSYIDPRYRYSLALNQGRMVAGDFDGDGFADDIVMAKAIGPNRMRIMRMLFDGPGSVTVSRQVVNLPPARIGDRMLVGDFDSDGVDDVGFVVQQADGSFQLKVWSSADAAAGIYLDPRWRYALNANQGRLISGDFDADGFADDIVMAKRLDAQHLGLRRFLLDGAMDVTSSQQSIRLRADRIGDGLVGGDFDNDGTDDAAFLVRRHDGTVRVRFWSAAASASGTYVDRAFGGVRGLIVSGSFDRS